MDDAFWSYVGLGLAILAIIWVFGDKKRRWPGRRDPGMLRFVLLSTLLLPVLGVPAYLVYRAGHPPIPA